MKSWINETTMNTKLKSLSKKMLQRWALYFYSYLGHRRAFVSPHEFPHFCREKTSIRVFFA